MNQDINVWGRDFSLEVVYDQYDGESVLQEQKSDLQQLLKAAEEITKSEISVRSYILKHYSPENLPRNIFSMVVPRSIFVKHSNPPRTAILCHFKLDPEHGLAIVFQNGKLIGVGSESIIF